MNLSDIGYTILLIDIFLTICTIKMFVKVKKSVTIRLTLPGSAERGMMKLKLDVITIAKHGR